MWCARLTVVAISTVTALQLGLGIAWAATGSDRARSKWAYELQRAQAHQHMEKTLYASTPSRAGVDVMCPALRDGRLGPPIGLDLRGAFLKSDTRRYSVKADETESDSESALDFFLNHISSPIVQAKCVNCHVEGGVSGHTRLILHPSSNPDHGTLNLGVFKNFLADVEDGATLILNKIQGVSHGGGIQVPAGSDDFANMETFLSLLGYGEDSGPDLSPETLFDTVTMASPGKTLWRSALIFGGKIPTREEREAVDNGTEEDLRTAIRNLMTGPGFHQFLIRASNDRLLTDRHLGESVIGSFQTRFVDVANLNWTKVMEARDRGFIDNWDDREWVLWWRSIQLGFVRAPLELVAHVVENDLPYTEVLTADYIMANPMASEAYGASTQFEDIEDRLEFRPSEIVSYYRDDDSKVSESMLGIGDRVLDPGNLITDYPHAGILNTTVFLLRYPTTPTNRNRARARWTYYHFLGLDIEKSASRTTDPLALADTNNPTMNNSACTVCHRVMDPVAGAFQNYGEEGHYRDEWGGQDSLDDFYKDPPDGGYTPYEPDDSWYRDMREPGFNGLVAPDAENSVQWLAEQIVADDRIAEATVNFWWPAIMGIEIATPPEDESDSDFEGILLASNTQTAEVERLAEAFRAGIAGGDPYNLKDLLVEIVLSPWFRAESVSDDDPVRSMALQSAGVERLLTPEELAWKTQAITGYSWGRWIPTSWKLEYGNSVNRLIDSDEYRLLYGGIDSGAVTERADDMTATMAAVAQSHALASSCAIVQREFLLWPDENRSLFGRIDQNVSPISEMSGDAVIESESWAEPETNSWAVSLGAGPKTVRLGFLNDFYDDNTQGDRDLILDEVIVYDVGGGIVTRVELETLDPADCQGPYWNDSLDRHDGYALNCRGWLDVPVSIPADGDYRIEVVSYQQAAGDEPAMLGIVVESDIETSRGAKKIRRKLVELHEKLLGATASIDSPDVEAAFRLFVETWEHKRNTEDWREERIACEISDNLYFEGIADDVLQYNEDGDLEYDWDRAGEILDDADWWDRGRQDPIIQTWVVVLAYLMTDYRYLFF